MEDVKPFLFGFPNFWSPTVQSGNDDASLSSFVKCNKQGGDDSSSTVCTQDSSFASRNVDICVALISKESPSLPLREELVSQGFETVRSPRGTALQCAIKKNKVQKAVTYEAYYESYKSCRSKRRSEKRAKVISENVDLYRKGCNSSLDTMNRLSSSQEDDDTSASSIYVAPYNKQDLEKRKIKYSSDKSDMLLCTGAQKDDLNNQSAASEQYPQNIMTDGTSKSNRLPNNKTTNNTNNIVYSSASSELTCDQKMRDFDERTYTKKSARGTESVDKTIEVDDESSSFSFSYFSAVDACTTEASAPELSTTTPKTIFDGEESCDGRISLASSSGDLMILVRVDFDSSKSENDIEDIAVDSNSFSIDRYDAPVDEDSYAFITDFPSFKTSSVSHTDIENTSAIITKQDYSESSRNSTGTGFEMQHFILKEDSNTSNGVEFNSQDTSLEIEHIQEIPDLELDSVTELLDRGSPRSEEKESMYEMFLPCCDHNTTDKTVHSGLNEQEPGWTKRILDKLDNLASCCGKFGKKTSQDMYGELENEGLSYTNSILYRDHDKSDAGLDYDMNNFESLHNESSYLSMGLSMGDSIFAYTDPGDAIGADDTIDGGGTRYCNQNIELIIPTHILAKQRGEGCYQSRRSIEELGMESTTSLSQSKQ